MDVVDLDITYCHVQHNGMCRVICGQYPVHNTPTVAIFAHFRPLNATFTLIYNTQYCVFLTFITPSLLVPHYASVSKAIQAVCVTRNLIVPLFNSSGQHITWLLWFIGILCLYISTSRQYIELVLQSSCLLLLLNICCRNWTIYQHVSSVWLKKSIRN